MPAAPDNLSLAMAYLQTQAAGITGMKTAPENFGDEIAQIPFSICFPVDGQIGVEAAGTGHDIHTFNWQIHLANNSLKLALPSARTYLAEAIYLLKQNVTLGGYVSTIVFPASYSFGRLAWGNDQYAHIGFQILIPVKIRDTITYS